MIRSAAPVRSSFVASLVTLLLLSGGVKAQTSQSAGPVGAPTVTVQRGDTAYGIAKRNGLTVDMLLAYNNLSSPALEVGQVLNLRPPVHTVQRGDTVYALSRRYGISVPALLAANTLPADAKLEVGQVIKLPTVAVSASAPTKAGPVQPVTASVPAPTASAGIVVGVSGRVESPAPVAQAEAQTPAPAVLAVAAPAQAAAPTAGPAAAPAVPANLSSSSWYSNAMSLIGTPYVLGGTTRRGIDCSGFVLQVFTPLGIKLPRVSADQARVGVPVEVGELRPGDLLFFDTVGRGKVTHVGIYLGNDTFINANSYYGKVVIDKFMSDKYWAPRFTGARRIMLDAQASY